MSGFTGRRPNERARSIGRNILDGLSAIGTAMADGPKITRINEIDEQIKNLQQERDHLVKGLVDTYEGYVVSDNYDPSWSKPEVKPTSTMDAIFGDKTEGRLTECRGRNTSSRYHNAHPGCPYVEQIHGKHEFTLRD